MAKDTSFSSIISTLQGKELSFHQPLVMGILNATPDSFFDGGVHVQSEHWKNQIEKMITEGVDIIDVGGYSTRPGAENISTQEEMDRVLPIVDWMVEQHINVAVSVDTFRKEIAEKVVAKGVNMINDVSGGTIDEGLIPWVAQKKVAYVLMHMRGTPQTMVNHASYQDVAMEVVEELKTQVDKYHRLGGTNLIIDPGFGFAKTPAHNFELLKQLVAFQTFQAPILVGISRKSMIYKTLNSTPQQALNGTTALHMYALERGANILRVHDVKEAKEVINLWNNLR